MIYFFQKSLIFKKKHYLNIASTHIYVDIIQKITLNNFYILLIIIIIFNNISYFNHIMNQ